MKALKQNWRAKPNKPNRKLRIALVCCTALGLFMYGCAVVGSNSSFAQGNVVTQGLDVMGVQAWHDAGFTGSGVTVAVWDFGFYEYEQLIGSDLPSGDRLITQTFGVDIAGDPGEIASDPDSPRHGTAVAEVVYDIAPDATMILLATSDANEDMMAALEWLIEQSVDVVVASLSLPDFGCLDVNESFFEPLFAEMRDAGILLVAASGNDRISHWQGVFNDVEDDGYLDFIPSDDSITVEAFEGDSLDLTLAWDDPCFTSTNDYDLFVFDEFGELVAQSVEDNSVFGAQEYISDVIPADGLYDIVIMKVGSSASVQLDLVWPNGPEFEYVVEESSISFFEPAISPNVFTIGSVNWSTLELEETSSEGPTKDGRTKPDVVGPTCVQTNAYGGSPFDADPETCGFSGTSASAPHVAGVAVLVKQAFPDFTPDEVQGFIEFYARDLGMPGKDSTYGAGLVMLPSP